MKEGRGERGQKRQEGHMEASHMGGMGQGTIHHRQPWGTWYVIPLPVSPCYPSCQPFPLGQSPGKSHKLTTNSWLVPSPKLSRPLLQGSIYQIIPNLQKATKSPVLSRTLPHHKALCSQLPPLSCSICCLRGALNCSWDMLNPSGSAFSAANP